MKREDIIKMMEGDEFAWVTQDKTLIDIATTPNEDASFILLFAEKNEL